MTRSNHPLFKYPWVNNISCLVDDMEKSKKSKGEKIALVVRYRETVFIDGVQCFKRKLPGHIFEDGSRA